MGDGLISRLRATASPEGKLGEDIAVAGLQEVVIIFLHPCGVQGAQLPAGCGQSPRVPFPLVPYDSTGFIYM